MPQYDVFQAGFNNSDETINFGKRAIADKSLYEITTFAVIRSSSDNLLQPKEDINVTSYFEPNGRLFIGINNCLRIIHSLSQPEMIATIESDSILETISVSSDGNYVLICTKNGEVVIKDISSLSKNSEIDFNKGDSQFTFPSVFSEKVNVPEEISNIFVESHVNGDTFYFITSNGLIKKIAFHDSKFHSEVIHDFSSYVKMAAFAFPFVCFEGSLLYTLNLLNGEYCKNVQFHFRSLLAAGGNFIGYDQSYGPHMISADQCMVMSLNEVYPHLVTVYKSARVIINGQKRFIAGITGQCIQMVSISDASVVYEIPIEDNVHLINTKSDCDDMVFVLKAKNHLHRPQLYLQCVSEADPELRVKRLVQQGLIDKAEEFAKTFNVNSVILAEAKAEYLLENDSAKDVDELLRLLDSTPNLEFRLHCCEYVTCQGAKDIRKVLSYAAYMDINVRDCKANDCNPLLYLKRRFNLILHKFDTFMSVYEIYDSAKWDNFMHCDLLDEIKLFLRKGDAERAALIFSRLDPSDIEGLTKEKILELTSILDRMNNDRTFIDIFVPLTLKHNPYTLMTFVGWIQSRVYQLEKTYNEEFPDCAIKFLEDITSLMNPYIPTDVDLNGGCRERLTNLLISLRNIELLVNNCFIKLPLSEYLCEPEDLVRNLLNLNMETERLELLLRKFLYPFMLECGVDPDELLEEEMTNILCSKEVYWVDLLTVVLKFMCNVDKKLLLIKKVLENTSKPWSDQVRKITKMAFEVTTSNPLVDTIRSLLNSEKQLVVMEKYEISKKEYMADSDKSFYYRRIIYKSQDNLAKAIEDIHEICANKQERFEADVVVILDLIHSGNHEKALALLNSIASEDTIKAACRILQYLMRDLADGIMHQEYKKYCYNALKPIYNCIIMNGDCVDTANATNMYRIGKAIYEVFQDFQIQLKTQDLQGRHREQTLQMLFWRVTETMSEDDTASFSILLDYCNKFSTYFGYPLDTVLQKFMESQSCSKFTMDIGEKCLQLSRSSDVLTKCAVNVFKISKDIVETGQEETFLDVIIARESEPVDDLDAVRLARKLCIKALMNAPIEQERRIIQTFRWIDSCYYLAENKPFTHNLSQNFNIYLDREYSVSMSCEPVRTLFSNYLTFIENPSSVCIQQEYKQELEEFTWNLQRLIKQEQYLSVTVMLKMLIHCHYLQNHDIPELVQPLKSFLLETVLPELINAVLSQNNVDRLLLFNLMQLFGYKKCEKMIHKYLMDYKKRPEKLSVVSAVGLLLLNRYQVEQGKSDLVNIFNLCKWWFRIGKVEMKYETYFSSKPDARLDGLLKEDKVGLDDIVEFSGDFGLDLQDCYLKYLRITLTSWQPDMEIVNQLDGTKNVVVRNNHGLLMSKYLKAVERISDKNKVFKLTEQIWPLINFYYYEVCLVVLDIHRRTAPSTGPSISMDYTDILFFLKSYKRVSKPSRSEIEQWYGNFPFQALIDPLSEFRLPLTSTFWSNDIWDIIKPEVNLDTYKQWFKVTLILRKYLTEQDICTYAINSPLASGAITKICDNWELSVKYEHLLTKVDQCAAHIKDLERATAAVYTLMCGMPPGADKVQMAQLSYKYAKMYKEIKPDDAEVEKVYIKVKQRYLSYSAIHILHKYQLGEEKYFKQVAQPLDLIWELYNDSRIDKHFDDVIFKCPSINKAVEEICSLFVLSVKKESNNVLLRLLKYSSSIDLHSRRIKSGKENAYLKRACYLCRSESNNWPKVLIELGLKDSVENDLCLRANALRCFRYIWDTDNIDLLGGMDIVQFSIYLDKLQVLAKMSELGMKFDTVEQLDHQNPKRIMKNLAKINKPLAIKCIANLCKIYGFDDLQYWDYIINSAVQFNMYRDLQDYLEFLQGRCMSSCIKAGWAVILSNALSDINTDSKISVPEISLLLQTCPVIYELEVDRFVQKCELAKRSDIANILRKFSKPE